MANSRFYKYLKRVDEIVEAEQRQARELEARAVATKARAKELRVERLTSPSAGAVDPDEKYTLLRAVADKEEAERRRDLFWFHASDRILPQLKLIRSELCEELDRAFCADPKKLDAPTIALLESGICRADELEKLLDRAAEAGNTTLARLIGSYALRAAETTEKDPTGGDDAGAAFRAVASKADEFAKMPEAYTGLFDIYIEAVERAVDNPQMMMNADDLSEVSAVCIDGFARLG